MKTKDLGSWEEFELEIGNLFNQLNELRAEDKTNIISDPLFRGQKDKSWKLDTTLERAVSEKISCQRYHRILNNISSHIESITGVHWESPVFKESDVELFPHETYPFMAYLRHHRFPSPLLDWTHSPYIAAFFAFNDFKSQKDAAIFVYIEHFGTKGFWETEGRISTFSSNITTHKRHYLQQSKYTICTKKEDDKNYFLNHEKVFSKNSTHQDFLIKYTIPASERQNVLKKLDLMNINSYSLFQNEEGLMDTLALREFIINAYST